MCESHGLEAFRSVAGRGKTPYKPVRCMGRRTSSPGRPPAGRNSLWAARSASPAAPMGKKGRHEFARQFQVRQDLGGRCQDLRLLQPSRGGETWIARNFAPALLDEGAFGKFVAQRRR